MTSYEFTCPDCGREIPVTDPMRDATLVNGCPVCGRSVTADHFAT
ncbi:zinc ribbon domain-containing protein [Haloarchaeobius amylolyticus]|uniref:Zinc ribbon domain-containing protein n=1 Tax=Haloarchaeobius amylolyticus TaxID=1198296 RepID=A0ABD6BDX4_9EURY